jgi:hypothetical protein
MSQIMDHRDRQGTHHYAEVVLITKPPQTKKKTKMKREGSRK